MPTKEHSTEEKLYGKLLKILHFRASLIHNHFSSVQSLSHVRLIENPITAARQASLSFTKPEHTQTHGHRVDDAIQPSHPLSSPSPPALIFLSIRVFSNESTLLIRWPEYWSFSSNIHWIIEKAREIQKNIYFCFIDYAKAFNCVDHNKL